MNADQLDQWRERHHINAHATVASADAGRDPMTGKTDEDLWRNAFGPKKTPQGVLQTPGYDPKAVLQSQQWANQAGVQGPLNHSTQGVGTVLSDVNKPGYMIDPYTHNVDYTRSDGQGGYTIDPTASNAASIGAKYADSVSSDGLRNINSGTVNSWGGDKQGASGSVASPPLNPWKMSLNQDAAGNLGERPGMATDMMSGGELPPLQLNAGQNNPSTSLYTPGAGSDYLNPATGSNPESVTSTMQGAGPKVKYLDPYSVPGMKVPKRLRVPKPITEADLMANPRG